MGICRSFNERVPMDIGDIKGVFIGIRIILEGIIEKWD